MDELITLEGIGYSVSDGESSSVKSILKNVSFDIRRGRITGLAGESGCGKTTVAKIIAGIYQPAEGTIKFNFSETAGSVQMLFQNSSELINPLRRVRHILEDVSDDSEKIASLAGRTGLSKNLLDSFGYQLSGGERQRAALCRLLLAGPELLILDEPFSAQDAESKVKFHSLLKDLNKTYGLTILCISHEIDKLIQLEDDLVIMFGGMIAEYGSSSSIAENPSHHYTKFLVDSTNYKLGPNEFKIEEEAAGSEGCVYYGRCSVKNEKCKTGVAEIRRDFHRVYCNFPLD